MRKKTEILYGIHSVSEALRARRRIFIELYIAKDKISKRLNKVVEAAEALTVPIKKIETAKLEKMTAGNHHQGIGAVSTIKGYN